jgi:hypothetical protein
MVSLMGAFRDQGGPFSSPFWPEGKGRGRELVTRSYRQ